MVEAAPNLSESAWARGWSDTKRGLKSWQFVALEVIGGGVIGIAANPFAAIVFLVGVAFALWMGAAISAPVRQRDEARQYSHLLKALVNEKVDVRIESESLVTPEMSRGKLDGPRPYRLFLVIKNVSHRKIDNLIAKLTRITLDESGFQTPQVALHFLVHENKTAISINPNAEERALLGGYTAQGGKGTYVLGDRSYPINSSLAFVVHISAGSLPAFAKEFILEQQPNGFSLGEVANGTRQTPKP